MQAVAVLPRNSFARAEADEDEGSELVQQWQKPQEICTGHPLNLSTMEAKGSVSDADSKMLSAFTARNTRWITHSLWKAN